MRSCKDKLPKRFGFIGLQLVVWSESLTSFHIGCPCLEVRLSFLFSERGQWVGFGKAFISSGEFVLGFQVRGCRQSINSLILSSLFFSGNSVTGDQCVAPWSENFQNSTPSLEIRLIDWFPRSHVWWCSDLGATMRGNPFASQPQGSNSFVKRLILINVGELCDGRRRFK